MRYAKVLVSAAVSIAIMIVIFSFSGQDSGQSNSLSDRISAWLVSIFVSGFDSMASVERQWWISAISYPIRKIAHATEYAILSASLVMTCWQASMLRSEAAPNDTARKQRNARVCICAFLITVLYACTDEIHQLFIDGRSGQISDVFVDAGGALIAWLVAFVVL